MKTNSHLTKDQPLWRERNRAYLKKWYRLYYRKNKIRILAYKRKHYKDMQGANELRPINN